MICCSDGYVINYEICVLQSMQFLQVELQALRCLPGISKETSLLQFGKEALLSIWLLS